MGRKERRLRDQQELRQSILDAAREIALAEGWRNVTMRKIAERIEYSYAAIYDYFENKDVLLQELVREGFRLLGTELRAAQMQVHDPVEALRLIGRGYLTFAWRYPELYRVMYGLDGATFTPETYEGGQQIDDVVSETVRQALEFRGWPMNHLAEKVNILWSTAHGLVTLTMADRISGGQTQALHLLDWAIQDSLLAWEHDTNASFPETFSEGCTTTFCIVELASTRQMTGGRRCGRKRLPVERTDQPSLRPFPQDNRARSEPLFAPLLHQPPKPPLNRAILPALFGMRPNPPSAFSHVTARVHSAWKLLQKSRTARQRHQYVRSVGCRWCACVATGAGNTVQTPAERGRIEPGAPRLLRVQLCRSGSSGRPSPDCHGSPSRVAVPPMHHMLHS